MSHLSHTRRLVLGGLATGLALTSVPQAAEACGGLFCSRQRIDQAGEKILFATDGQNVTAYVQIQYQGDADKFSWIVPVPTEPTVALGSDALFTTLRATTRPQFGIRIKDEGKCKVDNRQFAPSAATTGAVSNAGGALAADSAVQVLQRGTLGAFDVAVIKSDTADALKTWLKANDYILPDKLDPLLSPYVAGKYDFVAVKLQKNAASGDIQPIVLKYKSTKPGIPIRLTGIAATPDMDVYCWVLGNHRAIPDNYKHATINEARIDWLGYAPTPLNDNRYRETVTEAMNEAGGQAFVTDYAGDSAAVDVTGFDAGKFSNVDALKQQTDPIAFAHAVASGGYFDPVNVPSNGPSLPDGYVSNAGGGGFLGGGFAVGIAPQILVNRPGVLVNNGGAAVDDQAQVQPVSDPIPLNAQLLSYLKRVMPRPMTTGTGAVEDDYSYYGNLSAHRADLKAFNAASATDSLKQQVVQPYQDIKTLFTKNPYLTALYTTMSPEEMTQDPTFVFNAELPKVSSMHLAEGLRTCSEKYLQDEAPITITLRNGLKYTIARDIGIIGVGNGPTPGPSASPKAIVMPAADSIEQLSSTGLASIIKNNRDIIAKALGFLQGSTVTIGNQTFGFNPNGQVVSVPGNAAAGGGSKATSTFSGGFGCAGCSATNTPSTKQGAGEGTAYALVFMGFLGYRRMLGRRKRK